jgi:hypothetical protein
VLAGHCHFGTISGYLTSLFTFTNCIDATNYLSCTNVQT